MCNVRRICYGRTAKGILDRKYWNSQLESNSVKKIKSICYLQKNFALTSICMSIEVFSFTRQVIQFYVLNWNCSLVHTLTFRYRFLSFVFLYFLSHTRWNDVKSNTSDCAHHATMSIIWYLSWSTHKTVSDYWNFWWENILCLSQRCSL